MSGGGTVRLLGIAGSLRHASYNPATLRAAQELAPEGMQMDSFDLAPIPLYNEDVRQHGYRHPSRRCVPASRPPRAADRHARIQLLHPRRAEERHRLGHPPAGATVRRQAGRPHGRVKEVLVQPRAIPPAAVFRVPQRAGDEPSGGHDPRGAEQIRRGRQTHRPADARLHGRPSCRLQGLGAAA